MRLNEDTCKKLLDFLSIRLTGGPCQIGQVGGENGQLQSYKLMFGGVSVFMRKTRSLLKVVDDDHIYKSFLKKIINYASSSQAACIMSSQCEIVPVISPGITVEQLLLEMELNEVS